MKIFLKCQYCHHAVGQVLDLRGRHLSREEGQRWVSYRTPRRAYVEAHLEAPYQLDLANREMPSVYHLVCEETYDFWKKAVVLHKFNCHLEDCPHSYPYPFRRFSLPLSLHSPTSPTTLGEPLPTPEEVERLLRL